MIDAITGLAVLKVLTALACLIPALAHFRGYYDWHPDADLAYHYLAGFGLAGMALLKVQAIAGLAIVLAIALAWEYVEPRIGWAKAGGLIDTATDIVAVMLGAGTLLWALTAATGGFA